MFNIGLLTAVLGTQRRQNLHYMEAQHVDNVDPEPKTLTPNPEP